MTEATEAMGIGKGSGKQTFSNDILLLEIAGPNEQHFSVIDVPGIFRSVEKNVTTLEDMKLVNDLVRSYMANSRSVMLAVIPCNVDIATQEILQRAQEFDPSGLRTLGVLTKPDLVDKGAEDAVIELLNGEKHRLKLGWHVLKNFGQSQLKKHSHTSRNSLETDFFNSTKPWNNVAKDKVGIASLTVRLRDILTNHIRREFRKVQKEIEKLLKTTKFEKDKLGPKRQTEAEQRQFMMGIAAKFQSYVESAIKSDYSGSSIFDTYPEFKLATKSYNRAERFALSMSTNGHLYDLSGIISINKDGHANDDTSNKRIKLSKDGAWFRGDDLDAEDWAFEGLSNDDDSDIDTDDSDFAEDEVIVVEKTPAEPLTPGASPKKRPISTVENDTIITQSEIKSGQKTYKFATRELSEGYDISDIVVRKKVLSGPVQNVAGSWLQTLHGESRGFKLGTFAPHLLAVSMKQQSLKWEHIALGYTSDVITIVHASILTVLKNISPNRQAYEGLKNMLMETLKSRYQKAMKKTKFLLTVEREGRPATHNHYFADNLNGARQAREIHRLTPKILPTALPQVPSSVYHTPKSATSLPDPPPQKLIRLEDILSAHHTGNSEYIVQEMNDILEAYYKVALKRFVDNVRMQVVDHYLILGEKTPLKLSSPSLVAGMDAEQLDAVIGEDASVKRRRVMLDAKLEKLEMAKKALY